MIYNCKYKEKCFRTRKLCVIFFALLIALSLVSCRHDEPEVVSANTSVASPEASPSGTATPAASPKTVSSDATVLFIGNSLTFTSGIPEKLSSIALSKNCGIAVQELTHPGYALSKHLRDFQSKEFLKSYIRDADIVILQELGKYQGDTVEAIQGLQELFGEDKQYYFLETEYSNFFSGQRETLTDITFIRSGFVHDQLIENRIFKYTDLHLPNDSHPNDLYGYLAAFTVFCNINHIRCSDYFTVEEMTRIIGEQSVQGVTAELESDVILKILAAVDAALEGEE